MHYLVCHNPKLFVVRSARKESNLQPSSYKDAALTTEPRAASRAGGNRTHTERIKSPSCCLLHHNPECWLSATAWPYSCRSRSRSVWRGPPKMTSLIRFIFFSALLASGFFEFLAALKCRARRNVRVGKPLFLLTASWLLTTDLALMV